MQTFPVEINGLPENRQFVPQLQFQTGAHIFKQGDAKARKTTKRGQCDLTLPLCEIWYFQHSEETRVNIVMLKLFSDCCKTTRDVTISKFRSMVITKWQVLGSVFFCDFKKEDK